MLSLPHATIMSKLVIVESPAKSRTIEKYLGENYEVVSSVGHVRDLPKSNKNAIDIEAGFVPNYQIVSGKEEVVDDIVSRAQSAEEVILATDPDREGEAIAWHLTQAAGLKNPKRIVFHEITKEAVQEALEHPRNIDANLKTAQEARRVLDRLFGYELSGLIWKKVRYGLSAGRVQSPALRILMEREREIRAFEPQDFWVITADVRAKQKTFTLTAEEEPTDEGRADEIVAAGKDAGWNVTDVTEREQNRAPRAPFITSTLQQTASSRLGFSPSRTMRLAQKLYEAGHITYMRTDSTNLAAAAKKQIQAVAKSEYGAEYAESHTYKTKSKSAQEAHEAVRPTDANRKTAGKNADEKKLYDLIWRRAVASQMAAARISKTKVTVQPESKKATLPKFAATGTRVLFDGWFAADPAARSEENELPKVAEGDAVTLADIAHEAKQTQPPNRYTEAGLVKELEKRGIGRPSTYASIIQTIVDRGYVNRDNRTLFPSDLGDVVSSFLEEHFAHYISDTFTAEMENELDEIARGEREYVETLSEFYKPFHEAVEAKQDIEKITTLGPVSEEYKCPECGSGMVYKLGKQEVFMSCDRFPDCEGKRRRSGEVVEGPKSTGETCPDCEKGELVERDGRYGKFISCDRYPKCKYVKQDPKEVERAKTGIACPECKKGDIMQRHGRFGPFYSCSEYPDCKYAMKARPTGNTCPECGKLMMEGTKTIPERCSDKNCPQHNPHKQQETKTKKSS